jgi:hypothetical protein
MMNSEHGRTCINCGYEFAPNLGECPLCGGGWQGWELLFAPLPGLAQPDDGLAGAVAVSVRQMVASRGLRVRLYAAPKQWRCGAPGPR